MAILSLAVALIGLVIMFVNSKPPPNGFWIRVGEIMFFCGLLSFLLGTGINL